MDDPGTTPPPRSLARAALWAAFFGGGGVLLLAAVLFAGFVVVLLLIAAFLRLVGQPVGLHRLYDGGGDIALHGLLGGHLPLLGLGGVLTVLVAWLVLGLLRRSADVRRWWPSAQGVLAAAAAYTVVGAVALVTAVVRPFAG